MRKSQGSKEEKQRAVKGIIEVRPEETPQRDSKVERPPHIDAQAWSQTRPVVTEEQYRQRVSQKAYELYEKRRTATHVDDWVEAERVVKSELLAEGQWAGSV